MSRPRPLILHCITTLASDGAQRMLGKLVAEQDGEFGRENSAGIVTLINSEGTVLHRELSERGIPIWNLGMRRGIPTPTALAKLRNIIRRERPTLVLGWMYHGNLAASLAIVGLKDAPPVMWNMRHTVYDIKEEKPLTRLLIRLGSKLSSRTARIIYCAKVSAEQHEALGYDPSKTCVIPNGFDTTLFSPNALARSELRERLGLNSDALIIGAVGRFHNQKDYPTLLRATASLIDAQPRMHLVMLGRDVSSDNPELAELIEELNLSGRVHLLGEQDQVQKLMPAFDVFCLSAAFGEAFPNVLGEAMSCGVPCVSTEVGAAEEILGDTGSIVAKRSVDQLSHALNSFLSLPANERHALGRAARRRVEELFDIELVRAQYYDQFARATQQNTVDARPLAA